MASADKKSTRAAASCKVGYVPAGGITKKSRYEVTVCNIGYVHRGGDMRTAKKEFHAWVRTVKAGDTRGSSPVTLWQDGNIELEWRPSTASDVLNAWTAQNRLACENIVDAVAANLLLDEDGNLLPDEGSYISGADFISFVFNQLDDAGLIKILKAHERKHGKQSC